MNIREFILELKKVTENYTSEEYYNALIRLARNISPAERMAILNVLESTRNQKTDDIDTGSLLEDIKAFYNRVKNGEYYDHWGWDVEIHEERDFGDESWAEEMDTFFKKVRHAYTMKDYRLAINAYEMLFSVFRMADEPGHLPRRAGYDEMLVTDLKEEGLCFLKAALISEKTDKRHERFHGLISEYRYFLPMPLDVEKLMLEMDFPEDEKNSFLLNLIKMYETASIHPHLYKLYIQPVLFQALLLTGGVESLKNFAIKNGKNNPEAFEAWICELKKDCDERAVLEAARTGLNIIPKRNTHRARIAEYIAEIGRDKNNPGLILEGVREAFYSSPSLEHLVQLYDASGKCDCSKDEMNFALNMLEERFLPEKLGRKSRNDDMDRNLLNQAYIMMGKYRESFALCKNNQSLGWSNGNNPKGLTVPYLIYLLGIKYSIGQAHDVKNIKYEWKASFELSLIHGEKVDIRNSFLNVTNKNAVEAVGTIPDEEAVMYIKWCKKEVSKRIDDIVGNQYRGSYFKAAGLLVAMNDLVNISGQEQWNDSLLTYFQKKYCKHSAFRKEINNILDSIS
jgi:hypothetical protein